MALYLLGVPAQALLSFTVAAARAALQDGHVDRRPIPVAARPLLIAQLLRRDHESAASEEPYLDLNGARRHLEILIDARRDLGIPIDGRNLRNDHTSNPTRLLNRLGLKIRSMQ